jgi:hypothetical protein
MTRSAESVPAGVAAQAGAWGRGDAALFVLLVTDLALIAVQFALAGFGAFAMDKTPTDNAYGAHMATGLVIAGLTLIILVTVLASRPARARRRTLWPTVVLAVLTIAVQPALGEAGTKVPAVGALHGLNGLVIAVLAAWLTVETARRRAAAR